MKQIIYYALLTPVQLNFFCESQKVRNPRLSNLTSPQEKMAWKLDQTLPHLEGLSVTALSMKTEEFCIHVAGGTSHSVGHLTSDT